MRRMPTNMTHSFSQVPKAKIPRSSFDRSYNYKTTFNAGQLIPIFVDEAVPGDTFNLKLQAFARLATPIKPLMDNMVMETFYFAVPKRLLWVNWNKFMGEQLNPGDSTDFTIPQVQSPAGGWATGSLGDYFGLPLQTSGQLETSALPFRAYNLIFNEWFRDQNLVNRLAQNVGDGPDSPTGYTIARRGKRHDYFTSCLPWPQKGNSVTVPIGTTAPVVGIDANPQFNVNNVDRALTVVSDGSENDVRVADPGFPTNTYGVKWGSVTGLQTDLSAATAVTINELRQAFQIQKLLERDARGGTRYIEIIRSHFGVVSPDARQQRPEYLGGGRTNVIVSPIAQTAPTDSQQSNLTPQGNLAAMGTASIGGHGFFKSFTEHCVVIGLVCVRADLNYQQGIERMWSRKTRYDFYWPALAMLGEQAVLRKEIFATGTPADDDQVFGYQERYAEYRYKPSKVTGLFRSKPSTGTSLDLWHLAQDFGSAPVLNSTFIEENPPVQRVIAVQDEPHFLFDSYTAFKCARPMPVYGVPGLIDHF